MPNTEIDVIIPVYRPGEELRRLLRRLTAQTIRPTHILLVNTQEELFDPECMDGIDGVQVDPYYEAAVRSRRYAPYGGRKNDGRIYPVYDAGCSSGS